jgi:hypothetical protein
VARYIVVRLEQNESAEQLLKKFETVPAIEVVGVFASGTSFCPGPSMCGSDRKYVRSRKYGTLHCTICKKPVTSASQTPRNLLYDEDLHPRFYDLRLSVWEPLEPPQKKYGVGMIDRKKAQVELGVRRLKRHKAKKRREEANGG